MDSHDFVDSIFGRPGRSPGPHTYAVYLPRPIPRSMQLDETTTLELSRADRALGRLAGSGRLIKNPLLLADLYMRREALSSTRIEGTQATLDDLYEAESGGSIGEDVQEVINYVNALQLGLELITSGAQISVEMIKALHVTLMVGVRGEDKQPGVIRDRPNWIGSNDPATARFGPPPHNELAALLEDWERFICETPPLPPLVACALLHYQFETLHPFLDGNGRLGRLLIILFLVQEGHLPVALLYLSTYFEQHKQEYYTALQSVRERGAADMWLQYFLGAVTIQANDAVLRSERLIDLGEKYRRQLAGSRGRAHELIDALLAAPFITTQAVVKRLNISTTGAGNMLRQLEAEGILRPTRRIPGRSYRWVAHEVMDVLRSDRADGG